MQAPIAEARGGLASQRAAICAFIEISPEPCALLDLTLGRAGTLLGCVFLLDAWSDQAPVNVAAEKKSRLQASGHELCEQLWRTIDGLAPIRPEALHKGDVGVAVLSVDLERPKQAPIPMFEREM